MKTSHDDTRQHIIDTGNRIIASKGFSCVGLNEILQTAEVPKGSFYHYFKSKEQFGQALIEDYFESYLNGIDALFATQDMNAKERLMQYWQQWHQTQCEGSEYQKCLVVKLSGEVADLSEAMRIALRDGSERVIDRIAACIETGIQQDVLPKVAARDTAQNLYQLWLGASLLAKLHRNAQPLDHAMQATLQILSK